MATNDNAAKPAEHTINGATFYNAALTGSGTILPDGTYGEPLPDPTVQRGGPEGERKSPGGVERIDPNALTPTAQSADEATTSRTAKSRNQK